MANGARAGAEQRNLLCMEMDFITENRLTTGVPASQITHNLAGHCARVRTSHTSLIRHHPHQAAHKAKRHHICCNSLSSSLSCSRPSQHQAICRKKRHTHLTTYCICPNVQRIAALKDMKRNYPPASFFAQEAP